MPMMNFPLCWRRREDCVPFQAIDGVGDQDLTEDQILDLDYEPASFVCCGCINPDARVLPQDAYRVCWKNSAVDEMGDYDEQDLTHLQAVVGHALAVLATRRVNSGAVHVPAGEGQVMQPVETAQGS